MLKKIGIIAAFFAFENLCTTAATAGTEAAAAPVTHEAVAPLAAEAPVMPHVVESRHDYKYESGVTFGLGNGWEFGFGSLKGSSIFSLASILEPGTPAYEIARGVTSYTVFPCMPDIEKHPGLTGGYLGSLQVGWDCKVRDALAVGGVLLEGGFGTGKMTPGLSVVTTENGDTFFTSISYGKLHHRGYFACSLRGGLALGRVLLFGKIGYSGDSWRFRVDPFQAKSKWVNSLLLGVGADVNLTRCWLLGIGADVRIGGDAKFKNLQYTYDNCGLKFRPYLSNGTIWIKYKIPTCGM